MSKTAAARICAALLSALALFSCGKERGEAAETTETESRESSFAGDAPEDSLSGRKFTILRAGVEERETMRRSVRLRDMETEASLGVRVAYEYTGSDAATAEAARGAVLSGDGGYDLLYGPFFSVGSPLFSEGALSAADSLPGAEGATECFDESLTTPTGCYFITGPAVPESYSDLGCVALNRDTASCFSVKDPGQAVRDGMWTWDYAEREAAHMPEGAGLTRFAVTGGSAGVFALSAGGGTITASGEGEIPTVVPTPKGEVSEILAAVRSVLGEMTDPFEGEKDAPRERRDEAAVNAFFESRVLFLLCKTGDLPRFRAEGADFSVLPYPSVTAGSGTVAGADPVRGTAAYVPASTEDPGKTGAVLSAFSSLGEKYAIPEAYDAMLAGRNAYDERSRDILGMIFSGKRYELSLALAGSDGEEFERALFEAAAGEGSAALSGWELKAALVKPQIEALFADKDD